MNVEDLDLLLQLAEDGAVDVEWQKGDLVLIDVSINDVTAVKSYANSIGGQNYAVQHSRKPWKGTRQVLAALWDEDGRVGDFREGLKLLESSPRVPITDAED